VRIFGNILIACAKEYLIAATCNILMSKLKSRANNKRLSLRYYLSTDTIFWDDSGGDTFCQRCGGCGFYSWCWSLDVSVIEFVCSPSSCELFYTQRDDCFDARRPVATQTCLRKSSQIAAAVSCYWLGWQSSFPQCKAMNAVCFRIRSYVCTFVVVLMTVGMKALSVHTCTMNNRDIRCLAVY